MKETGRSHNYRIRCATSTAHFLRFGWRWRICRRERGIPQLCLWYYPSFWWKTVLRSGKKVARMAGKKHLECIEMALLLCFCQTFPWHANMLQKVCEMGGWAMVVDICLNPACYMDLLTRSNIGSVSLSQTQRREPWTSEAPPQIRQTRFDDLRTSSSLQP